MKINRQGFTLIELLAVIVVLAIVMVLAATSVLPYMSKARENAFRIEATNVVKAGETAVELYSLGKINFTPGSTASCISATKMCFSVDELVDLAIYDADKDKYSGRIEITNYNSVTPSYKLYLNKGTEFYIDGGTVKDYNNSNVTLSSSISENADTCTCS